MSIYYWFGYGLIVSVMMAFTPDRASKKVAFFGIPTCQMFEVSVSMDIEFSDSKSKIIISDSCDKALFWKANNNTNNVRWIGFIIYFRLKNLTVCLLPNRLLIDSFFLF